MEASTLSGKRLPAAERRLAIQRAAGPLFARHGYGAATLDEIAAAAGVTKPIVYRHFESKKDLYLALLAKHEDDLPTFFERVDPAALDGTPEGLVRAILDVWFDYVRENQHAWVMLFRDSSGDDEIRAFRRGASRRARRVMADFISTQPGSAIPPAQVEPTAELLRSGLAGLALWWIDNPRTPKSQLLDVAARLTVAAILPE
jgi:AcrR family transcriptional regulator